MYIQLCPGPPGSSADVCVCLLKGMMHSAISSQTVHQSSLKAQTTAQDEPQLMI